MQEIVLTQSEKIHLGISEIAKRIREQLKAEFPECIFSVRIERYSMGQSLHISLMKANFRVIRRIEEISEEAILNNGSSYTKEQIAERQKENYHQLNQYGLRENFNPIEWCNGVFLTEKAHNVLKRVVEITNQYNYDNSDPMTDYADVNFYLHIEIGQYNKPFIKAD